MVPPRMLLVPRPGGEGEGRGGEGRGGEGKQIGIGTIKLNRFGYLILGAVLKWSLLGIHSQIWISVGQTETWRRETPQCGHRQQLPSAGHLQEGMAQGL